MRAAFFAEHPPITHAASRAIHKLAARDLNTGTVLQLQRGDRLEVELPEPNRPGASWRVQCDVLRLSDSFLRPPAPVDVRGPSRRVFVLHAHRLGSGNLTLELCDGLGHLARTYRALVLISDVAFARKAPRQEQGIGLQA